MLDSVPPTAIPNRFLVPTKLETKRKLLSLIFSNNTACEPSTLAVIPAISNFDETWVFFLNHSFSIISIISDIKVFAVSGSNCF
jgi:hypothetical protein